MLTASGQATPKTNAAPKAVAGYVLFILCLISALNYYDRYLIGILVEDLKRDLHFSDSQIGLLSGLAFAIVYSVASLPIAAYADRGRRVRVLGIAAAFWSVMTGLCGFATGFWSLLIARFGVGIGEAGGAPTTHAIVAETFSPRWRATALAAIGFAGATGMTVAFAGGGYIAQHFGWRWAFFVAGLAGTVVAAIFALTVREPGHGTAGAAARGPALPIGQAVGILLRRRAFVWSCLGIAVMGIGAFGSLAWLPAYFMRHYGLSAAEVGASFSAVVGPTSMVGILLGGLLGDWLSRRDQRAPFWFLAATFIIATPFTAAYLLVEDYRLALALVFPGMLIGMLYTSPIYAAIQALSGPKLRATGAALFMLVVNLIGQGLGPLVIGALSDMFAATYGKDGLRYALLIGAVSNLLGAAAFLIAARTAREDIEAAARF